MTDTMRAKFDGYSDEEILAAAEKILLDRLQRQGAIKCPEDAAKFFIARLSGLPREEFHVAFLDTRHSIIACEAVSYGTIDGAEVHPREVVKLALKHNCAAVLLAHSVSRNIMAVMRFLPLCALKPQIWPQQRVLARTEAHNGKFKGVVSKLSANDGWLLRGRGDWRQEPITPPEGHLQRRQPSEHADVVLP